MPASAEGAHPLSGFVPAADRRYTLVVLGQENELAARGNDLGGWSSSSTSRLPESKVG